MFLVTFHARGMGSSPRMRGSLCLASCFRRVEVDHPRVCGAHQSATRASRSSMGSSPRMRGSRSRACCPRPTAGIIPAYAGLTSFFHLTSRKQGDHPRVCGAHLNCPFFDKCKLWIIPAYAGLTRAGCVLFAVYGDHPRVCGAHSRGLGS